MDSTSKIELTISTDNGDDLVVRGISESDNRSILDLFLENNIDVDHSCGGNGTCGTCRFILIEPKNALSQKNEIEIEMAQNRNFLENERLACQTQAIKSCKIKIS